MLINFLALLAFWCKITAEICLYFNFSVKKCTSKETSRNRMIFTSWKCSSTFVTEILGNFCPCRIWASIYLITVMLFCKGKKVPDTCWISFVPLCTAVFLETTEECGRHFVLSLSKEKYYVRGKSFRTAAVQQIRNKAVTRLWILSNKLPCTCNSPRLRPVVLLETSADLPFRDTV